MQDGVSETGFTTAIYQLTKNRQKLSNNRFHNIGHEAIKRSDPLRERKENRQALGLTCFLP